MVWERGGEGMMMVATVQQIRAKEVDGWLFWELFE